ncbi:GTP-binding protein YchF [Pneumocystis jirovecii RU7]|uniref:GTP-binding protein YchF n=1 Tax=Pneumocystis jirovecii (strain RU7) TaxID=1408657 RepID=A0A0W4ZV43_PNEJ7|nr:GTP-binding protein YchF [Pneumocystis jirovecii RU7]KTW32238.1 GTP-binding protein YchF [Pneumocystis jirovecii RU7]
MEFLNKQLEALKRVTSRGGQSLEIKANKEKLVVIEKLLCYLEVEKKEIRKGDWTNKEIQIINSLFLLTAKPVIYLVNLSEKDYLRQKNKWLPKIATWVKDNNPGDIIIPISVAFEERLSRMTDQEAQEECKRLKTKSMLPKIITIGYSSLNLIYYFTCGPDEVRAWTIRKGTKAPAAAGVIHTDFEKNFVVGEIMKFEDLKSLGSEAAVKSAGKYMTKGNKKVKNIISFKWHNRERLYSRT